MGLKFARDVLRNVFESSNKNEEIKYIKKITYSHFTAINVAKYIFSLPFCRPIHCTLCPYVKLPGKGHDCSTKMIFIVHHVNVSCI